MLCALVLLVGAAVVAAWPASPSVSAASPEPSVLAESANEGGVLVDPALLDGFVEMALPEQRTPLCPLALMPSRPSLSQAWVNESSFTAVAVSRHDGAAPELSVAAVLGSGSACASFSDADRVWTMTGLKTVPLPNPAAGFLLSADDGYSALVAVASDGAGHLVVVSVLSFAPETALAERLLLDALSRSAQL